LEVKPDMDKMLYRFLALRYAWGFVGTYYSWGGNNPMGGFDCSGLISEILQAFGMIGRSERLTAQGIRDRFLDCKVDVPHKGCLVFYHAADNPDRIIHIEFCIDDTLAIGASGGGSATKTKEDAIKHGAFIKIRPMRTRTNLWGFVDPFMKKQINKESD